MGDRFAKIDIGRSLRTQICMRPCNKHTTVFICSQLRRQSPTLMHNKLRQAPKSWGCCAPFRVGAGSPCNTVPPGLRPTSVTSAIYLDSSSRLVTIDMGHGFYGRRQNPCVRKQQKLGWAVVPLSVWAAGSPSYTMWPGPRPTFLPSFIFIDPTVWPQRTNFTDRQTG